MYTPSFLKAALTDTRPRSLTFSDLIDSNVSSTSSFKYEPLNYPLKSTQQLNVDWSKFENHTFFSSAEVKVNMAFEQIINGYPFDGKKVETERFFESLGGFEKWVFEQFPKFGGQLHFSSSWVSVKDSAGWLYPELSKNTSGESILNPPTNKSFTIEAQVFIPDQVNSTQVVLQKVSSDATEGFTLHLEPSSTSLVTASFNITSGNVRNSVSAVLEKGKFNHVCVSLNRETGNNYLQFFVNQNLNSESKKEKSFQEFTNTSDLTIGSGSSFYVDNVYTAPIQTFSGTLDELRVFHSYRTVQQQKLYSSKGLYAVDSLKLYYRFNEPSSSLSSNVNDAVNSIVLDSSGNSLHGYITNFTSSLRQSSTDDPLSPVKNERQEFKVILFPYHSNVIALNKSLLSTAKEYDEANPNLITKLIPRHYLREGGLQEGLSSTAIEGTIGDSYGGEGIPGQGQLGSSQIILTFLYIWSKFFDEIKMFVDAFKTLRTVDYSLYETIPDNFIVDFIKSYGVYLPPLFNNSNTSQYVDGEDITKIEVNDVALKKVQSYLLRRVLVNMPDILRSKGTQHSIRSFLRSIGIDPDNSLRIREFGGPSIKQFGSCREIKTEYAGGVDFTSSSLAISPYLSASRTEPGYPFAAGPFINGTSTYSSDGLLTSGSWTFEGLYRYAPKNKEKLTTEQSLVRFETTGSLATAKPGLIVNVVSSGSLYAFFRPGMSSNSPSLTLTLPVDILDGERWNISIGRYRNDSIDSSVSSSYFLRAAAQNAGEISKIYMTSSFFNETPSGEGNAFQLISPTANASGSRISIGNNSNVPAGSMGYLFLNSTLDLDDAARTADFVGQVSHVKFWSKGLSEAEWKEHVRNYKSYGVENALVNYNYVNKISGSFEKIRLSAMEKQTDRTAATDGTIQFLDFSENQFTLEGSGFPASQKVYVGDFINYSYISPYFDEYSTSEKIRIRGLQDEENLNEVLEASLGPAYELPAGESPLDDPRLSIEFSLIDSLNRDIISIFATLDVLSNAIGAPELAYSPDYPDLERLRDIYFNRLSEKLNFRGFFEFYRWFDTSISTFIQQLVPRKTRFKGTNFIIESHMLERHKIEYQSSEIYLGDATRSRIRDTLLVQQVAGKIGKY